MATRKKNAGNTNGLLIAGLVAVGGYFVYEWLYGTPAAATTTTTTDTGTGTGTGTGSGTSSGSTSSGSSSSGSPGSSATSTSGKTLDSIYAAILSTATGDPNFTGSGSNLSGSAYHFDVYLRLAAPGMTIPDSNVVFGTTTFFPIQANGMPSTTLETINNAAQPMTLAAYWAKMGPALSAANAGLSGGLGAFAGIGAFMNGLGAYRW